MRAVTQRVYGPPEVLEVGEVPEAPLRAGEVRIEVRASPVTQGDRRMRAGDYPGITWLPGRLALGLTGPRATVPGSMYAGRVVEVGAGVTRFAVGDDVFGAGLSGAWAERLVVREDAAIGRMPAGWSYAEAAALPYGAGTARSFLAGLKAGERVAVIGAAGGVGRYAVQLARHAGARVTAVARPAHRAWLGELGAEEVVELDGLRGRFDVVFDAPGVLRVADAAGWLVPGGRFLTLLVSVDALWGAARASWGGPRVITGTSFDDAASIEALRVLAEAGAVRARVGRRFALAEIVQAHAHLERDRPAAEVMVEPV